MFEKALLKVPIPVTYRHSAQNGTLHKRLSDLFPKVLVTPGGQEKKKKSIHNHTDRTAELRVEHVHICK